MSGDLQQRLEILLELVLIVNTIKQAWAVKATQKKATIIGEFLQLLPWLKLALISLIAIDIIGGHTVGKIVWDKIVQLLFSQDLDNGLTTVVQLGILTVTGLLIWGHEPAKEKDEDAAEKIFAQALTWVGWAFIAFISMNIISGNSAGAKIYEFIFGTLLGIK